MSGLFCCSVGSRRVLGLVLIREWAGKGGEYKEFCWEEGWENDVSDKG